MGDPRRRQGPPWRMGAFLLQNPARMMMTPTMMMMMIDDDDDHDDEDADSTPRAPLVRGGCPLLGVCTKGSV